MGEGATHGLTSIMTQACLNLFIRYESTMFDVMNEAQSFGIFLQPTRYVMGIAPEARSVEFVGDIPQHGMNFSQLLLRLSGGAKGKNMAVTGRLIQYSL